MTSSSTPKTALSAAQEKQLAYCMYYGYGNTTVAAPNNTQRNEFIATQAMVWIIEKNLFGTPQADSAAQKLCACAPSSAESYAYYETLRNKMLASYNVVIPSFASTTQSGAPTYELKWNSTNQRFETTLNDTNGALSNFNFSLSGYSMSRNGNQLTIYTSNVNTTPTVASATEGTGLVEPKSSCVYWQINKDKYQEFISTRPQVDPVSAYIRVKTESIGYGKVTKSDDKSGVTLSGAKYGIYSDSGCTRQVATMTTGADGTATSEGLVAGTYYVKEIQAPKGYVISDKVHTVLIRAGQTTSFSATNKEQMGAITIYKEGEVLADWNGSNFVYEMKKLQGASFKVTAGVDIYKSDGTKVHSKGDVIAERLTTGLDGKVLLTDLHLGTYVVTEIESIPGYTINENPQTVEVLYKDQTVDVQYEATTIRNARQKAEVSVMKKDSDTDNPLLGGAYTMYANNDIVNDAGQIIVSKGATLQTIETNRNGKATYTLDLPIENGFYVKETRAPEGYVRDSEVMLRLLIRLVLAEWFVANCVTIMRAFFTSIGNWVGMLSGGSASTLSIDSTQAEVIRNLGFGEGLIMLILASLLSIIIIICGFFLIYTVYFRFLRLLVIVPMGAIAFSTMGGNRNVSHTALTFSKYFLCVCFEAVTMAVAILICPICLAGQVIMPKSSRLRDLDLLMLDR